MIYKTDYLTAHKGSICSGLINDKIPLDATNYLGYGIFYKEDKGLHYTFNSANKDEWVLSNIPECKREKSLLGTKIYYKY